MPRNISDQQSIVFYSTWKCGSVVTQKILNYLMQKCGLYVIDFQSKFEYIFQNPIERLKDNDFLNNSFISNGFFFGPFKFFIAVPNLEKYKVIVQLRDPKDVLTSMYFSFAHSHPQIHEDSQEKRKEFQSANINDIALKYAPEFLNHSYLPYMKLLQSNDRFLFLKYEEMVTDFDGWLKKICDYLELNLSKEEHLKIHNIANFQVETEDIHSHKRAVKPGNYKKHLSDDTVKELNKIFEEVNNYFNY